MNTKPDKISQLNSQFSSLLKQETENRSKPKEWELVLEAHLDEIKGARELGVGYARIAALLNEAGVKANEVQVRSFCEKALGETRAKRKQRAKSNTQAKPKASPVAATKDQSKPRVAAKSSKPGFRSATSDEDL